MLAYFQSGNQQVVRWWREFSFLDIKKGTLVFTKMPFCALLLSYFFKI